MFFSCPCASTNCDHTVDMLKHNISYCEASDDVKMHPTKFLSIINMCYVLILKKLTGDIGNNKLCL